jgi:hypothetical protein
MHRLIFIALAALAAGAVAAQETPRPQPTDPGAKVPAVEYRSAFSGYRALAEEKVAPWRESNEAVKPPPEDKPKPDAKPAAGTHGGHR